MSRARILDLMKVQCRIFSHVYNPTQARIGTKILRERLKGPSIINYYPRKTTGIPKLLKELQRRMPDADIDTWDDDEFFREEHIIALKARGKGTPKKKKTASDPKAKKKR